MSSGNSPIRLGRPARRSAITYPAWKHLLQHRACGPLCQRRPRSQARRELSSRYASVVVSSIRLVSKTWRMASSTLRSSTEERCAPDLSKSLLNTFFLLLSRSFEKPDWTVRHLDLREKDS